MSKAFNIKVFRSGDSCYPVGILPVQSRNTKNTRAGKVNIKATEVFDNRMTSIILILCLYC